MTHVARIALPEAAARALADLIGEDADLFALPLDLREAGPDGFAVTLYFEAAPDAATLAQLQALAKDAGAGAARFTVEALPQTDWVAKSLAGLPPVRAGRFVVHGAHDRDKVAANEIGLEIEAGHAFGTGHHGTTAGCLLAIDRLAATRRPIRAALDIGTGSGVLAIAIARRTGARVVASDIDAVSARVAAENVRLNRAAARVTTLAADGVGRAIFRDGGPYDLIVANILAGPLARLAPAVRRLLAPGGTVILSGLLPEQRARIVAAYRGQGLRLGGEIRLGGWLTLVFGRGRRRGLPTSGVAGEPPSFGALLAASPLDNSDLPERRPARALRGSARHRA